jgi:hypothetical protein
MQEDATALETDKRATAISRQPALVISPSAPAPAAAEDIPMRSRLMSMALPERPPSMTSLNSLDVSVMSHDISSMV